MPTPILIMIIAWVAVAAWVSGVIFTQKKYHPKSLFILFFAEMWERFSFYGMRALLVLYMVKVLFVDMTEAGADERAYGIYGAYGALVYGTPVLGGLIADRFFGFRKAIIFGGLLMSLGHITLSLGDMLDIFNVASVDFTTLFFFFPGLALLIVGNGYFKPNISSLLGTLYKEGDPKRDSGFTLFYMGINVGAFLAPLTCGTLGQLYGWHIGFGLAGIGMIIGLITFWRNRSRLGDKGLPPNPEKLKKPLFSGLNREKLIILFSVLAIPAFAFLVNVNELMGWILGVLGSVILGVLLIEAFVRNDKVAGQRIMVIIILAFFHTLFWAFFEQAGSSINLFTDRNVNRVILGNEMPASTFQGINPAYIILLAPLFSVLWTFLSKLKKEPYTPVKFSLGLIQLGLGFGIFVLGAKFFVTEQGLVPLVFLALGYLLHTTGELCLSPVGLSMVTKLSPARIVGFVMGAWFFSISFAHFIAGGIAKLTSSPVNADRTQVSASLGEKAKEFGLLSAEKIQQLPKEVLEKYDSLAGYASVFWDLALIGVGCGLLLLILVPFLRKWMHGIH